VSRAPCAELAQAVHHVEGVALQPPASVVDPVGEPERAQVRVRRDVCAVDVDVVAGVGDNDEIVARDVEHAACELRASRAARQHDDGVRAGLHEARTIGCPG
jgi:hypothetical protein